MRTSAWWWRYGVPLEGIYIAKTTKKPAFGSQFLRLACHIAAPRSTKLFVIQDDRQSALEHSRKVHFKTCKEKTNNNLGRDLDRCHAIEVLRTNNLEQREVHNRLAKANSSNFLSIDMYTIIVPAIVVIIQVQWDCRTLICRLDIAPHIEHSGAAGMLYLTELVWLSHEA
jgi:hypothetical protein